MVLQYNLIDTVLGSQNIELSYHCKHFRFNEILNAFFLLTAIILRPSKLAGEACKQGEYLPLQKTTDVSVVLGDWRNIYNNTIKSS